MVVRLLGLRLTILDLNQDPPVGVSIKGRPLAVIRGVHQPPRLGVLESDRILCAW